MSSNNHENYYFIIIKDNNIISIYDDFEISLIECLKKINELIEFLIEVKKIYKNLDKSLFEKLKNFKIIEYIMNTSISNNIYYFCLNRFLFIDQNGLAINIKSSNLISNYLKYTKNIKILFNKIIENNDSILDITNNDTNQDITINNLDIENNNQDKDKNNQDIDKNNIDQDVDTNNINQDIIENLKNKINELEKIKNLKETLNKNNIENKKEVENFITKYHDEKNLKISINELKLKKEKLLEHQNIYDVDYKIFKNKK